MTIDHWFAAEPNNGFPIKNQQAICVFMQTYRWADQGCKDSSNVGVICQYRVNESRRVIKNVL